MKQAIKNKKLYYLDCQEWLMKNLQSKKESQHYLKVALDFFHKDKDVKAFLYAVRQVVKAVTAD